MSDILQALAAAKAKRAPQQHQQTEGMDSVVFANGLRAIGVDNFIIQDCLDDYPATDRELLLQYFEAKYGR